MRAFVTGVLVGAALGVGAVLAVHASSSARLPKASVDTLRVRELVLDTIYTVDTIALWRTRTRWDTALVDVERWKHDTIEVVRYVTLADSTIRTCTAALLTCEARIANMREQRDTAAARYAREAAKPKASLKRDAMMGGAGAAVIVLLRAVLGG